MELVKDASFLPPDPRMSAASSREARGRFNLLLGPTILGLRRLPPHVA